jgi:lipid A ethanolaminephosphotransferase
MTHPPETPAARPRLPRPVLSPLALNALVAAFLLAVHNAGMWGRSAELFGTGSWHFVLFGIAAYGLTLFVLALGSLGPLQKPWVALLILAAAAASYHADRLGVIVDREMLRNVLNTTANESRHLITPSLVGHMLLWGVLPAAAVFWVRLTPRRPLRAVLNWAVAVPLALALGLGPLLSDLRIFGSVLRQNADLAERLHPAAPLVQAVRLTRRTLRAQAATIVPLGLDARPAGRLAAGGRPVLTVLVIGETLRAQNWGLSGYARDTTPELARRDVVNFPQVEACGTSTAVSVPCIVSPMGQDGFDPDRARGVENLLDIAAHAGFAVEWWENNAGGYGLADRVVYRQMRTADAPDACDLGECTDEVFLAPFAELLAGIDRDTLLVLHTIGSHGPAYFLRYPPEVARFAPACAHTDFARCTPDEILNAYDNTILETDRVLARLIDMLAAQDRVASSLLFVSDHGESLGEGGLYLHGYPRALAPETQTRVPMVLWLSAPVQDGLGLARDCLERRAGDLLSHDLVFHTALGLMDIATAERDPALDLTGACRSPT